MIKWLQWSKWQLRRWCNDDEDEDVSDNEVVHDNDVVHKDNDGFDDNDIFAWKTKMMQARHQISSAVMP